MEINDSDGEIGLVSGEKCNRDGCNGIMHEIDDDSSCSCHIFPPCSHCVDVRFQCDECGYETETPSYSEINSKEASTIGIPDYFRWKSTEEKFNELKDNEFGYVTICGKYYWMEAKGKYPEGMTTEEILSKFNACFGYKWLKAPCNGQFHLKYYTDQSNGQDIKMTLQQHITQTHAGNVSHFARSIGVSRVQVARWLEYGCEWHNGRVLRPLFDVRNCQ